MKLCCDTNLFVAVLTNEPEHSDIAREVLNSEHELVTPIFTLMELRSVLMKKAQFERTVVEAAEQRIRTAVAVTAPGEDTLVHANER